MLLELLDGVPAGTLDSVLSGAAAFSEWLYLPAEVRSWLLACPALCSLCMCK